MPGKRGGGSWSSRLNGPGVDQRHKSDAQHGHHKRPEDVAGVVDADVDPREADEGSSGHQGGADALGEKRQHDQCDRECGGGVGAGKRVPGVVGDERVDLRVSGERPGLGMNGGGEQPPCVSSG